MKNTGTILAVVGGLLVLGGILAAFNHYDFSKSDDLSQFAGGQAIALGLVAVGLHLRKGKANSKQ